MDHLETFKPKKFFTKIFWIIHKFWSILDRFLAIWGLISPDWLKILTSGLLRLICSHFISLLTKIHEDISSSCRDIDQRSSKSCMKIGHFLGKITPWRWGVRKKWMTHLWKEIYRRFRISNQIFRIIYGSRDIERSLDTTLPVFGQNWHFVDEYLENGVNAGPEIFRDCF